MLLNNDVVVTDGWLDQLVALAGASAVANCDGPDLKSEIRSSKSEREDEKSEIRKVRNPKGRMRNPKFESSKSEREDEKSEIRKFRNPKGRLGLLGRCRIMRRHHSWSSVFLTRTLRR